MAIIELVADDFCDDGKCVKIGNVASAIARRFLADGSPNKFQAERDAWPLIHTGIVAGKLHPLDQVNRQQLSADNSGDGMVLFDELVGWGKWCKRFDFVNQQAVLALKAKRQARLERAITPQGSGCARPRYSPPPITAKLPDWGFWRNMPTVETWQVCVLALNIDPDSVDYRPESWDGQPETWRFPSDEIGDKFLKLLRLSKANLRGAVRLSEFAAWCAQIGYDIPPELAALANIDEYVQAAQIEELPADAPAAKVGAGAVASQGDIEGKIPTTTIGKLAIKAAREIECETKKMATASKIIERLQEWVKLDDYPELLEKIPHGVKWATKKGKVNTFDIGACEKTLERWNKSRH